jgi:hypothetical protein
VAIAYAVRSGVSFEIVLTSDQANIVAEKLLAGERQASDRAAAYRAGRSWSSLVLTIIAFVMCGLIFFTWVFVARHWSSGWRALGAIASVLPCFYVAVALKRRRLSGAVGSR